jgi:hypothetical protein
MNDNYVWDRTGESDPETQKLEELLGELRYQPRPLRNPANITVGRTRSFFLPMTIAAAIIMVALLSALWWHFKQRGASPVFEVKRDALLAPTPNAPNTSQPGSDPEQKSLVVTGPSNKRKPRHQINQNLLAVNKRPIPKQETFAPRLTPQELAEKEQVLVALRLVSAKLNLAQRKTQGLPPLNTIRNQHKIG